MAFKSMFPNQVFPYSMQDLYISIYPHRLFFNHSDNEANDQGEIEEGFLNPFSMFLESFNIKEKLWSFVPRNILETKLQSFSLMLNDSKNIENGLRNPSSISPWSFASLSL
jgi:hypothetical protein